MVNEIKEILELYKNEDIEYYNLVSDLGYDKLLIYITNLQEENKELLLELSGYREAILKNDVLLGLQDRIEKALHLMNHVEEYDYRLFIARLENILNGDE